MHSGAVRALSLAALAVGQSSLTVTENGTYIAEVTLDSVPVQLLVDTFTSGLWVRCSAIEDASCVTKVTSANYEDYPAERFYRTDEFVRTQTKRFQEVTIAGQVFHAFDAIVVYDRLARLHPSIQGVLGLNRIDKSYMTSAMYLDNQVKSVALQLSLTSSDSKLSFDTIDRALLEKKAATTKVSVYTQSVTCFQVPLLDGTSDPCSAIPTDAYFDPASPRIALSFSLMEKLERRYLYTCTKVVETSSKLTTEFVCDDTVELPRLTVVIASYNFFLDPEDYTTTTKPLNGSALGAKELAVLIGEDEIMYSGLVLGAPFLRKFPVSFDATSGMTYIYCSENTTCTKVPTKYSSGTSGGGGGGTSEADGGGYGLDVDVSVSRKRRKWVRALIIGVASVVFAALCGCCCKYRRAEEDAKEEPADVALAVVVETEAPSGTTSETAVHGAADMKGDAKDGRGRDSSSSSSYDSDSSEEYRQERERRRERRRKRHARRKQKEAKGRERTTLQTEDAASYYNMSTPVAHDVKEPSK